jgi:site-specific DNA-cytosine methylase
MSKIRIGTDCSGIEAPIQALKQLKIPFEHVFSSEIDDYCIQSIKSNYTPNIIFGDKEGMFPEGDITKRNVNDIPDIDLYVCGFPCHDFYFFTNKCNLKKYY